MFCYNMQCGVFRRAVCVQQRLLYRWKLNISILIYFDRTQEQVCLHSTAKAGRNSGSTAGVCFRTPYLYVFVLSFGPWSSSSFDRSYGSPVWCCKEANCIKKKSHTLFDRLFIFHFVIRLPFLHLWVLTWPPAVRWASISVSFPNPPTGPTLDRAIFFFLPRLEGAGITTTWDATSPSFRSTTGSPAAG